MTPEEQSELLYRLDERVAGLVKSMDNHLNHHQQFEDTLEKRLDELASRNIFTPIIHLVKWIWGR